MGWRPCALSMCAESHQCGQAARFVLRALSKRVHRRVHGDFCRSDKNREKFKKCPFLFGGRTRTRTLDPLIKSQHNIFDSAKNFSQLSAKCVFANQKLASNFPTAIRLGDSSKSRHFEINPFGRPVLLHRYRGLRFRMNDLAALGPSIGFRIRRQ